MKEWSTDIQNRTSLQEKYELFRRFEGVSKIGSYNMWACLGQYIDFQGSRNSLHKHSFYEACLVLQGVGEFYVDQKYYRLSKGDLFIADPKVTHEIISSLDQPLCIHFVSFSFLSNSPEERGLSNSQESGPKSMSDQKIGSFLDHHAILSHNCDELGQVFSMFREISFSDSYEDWFCLSESLVRFLVMRILTLSGESYEPFGKNFLDPRVSLAMQFIRDNTHRHLTVEEIAWHANTSSRTLRRLFQEYFDTSIVCVCRNYRIEESAKLLASFPHRSIADIGYSLGYESPSDFSRTFKQVKGVSPKEFRSSKGTTFIN